MMIPKIFWYKTPGGCSAAFMGLDLAVISDPDGTFTASVSGGSMRPLLDKNFKSIESAKKFLEENRIPELTRAAFTGVPAASYKEEKLDKTLLILSLLLVAGVSLIAYEFFYRRVPVDYYTRCTDGVAELVITAHNGARSTRLLKDRDGNISLCSQVMG